MAKKVTGYIKLQILQAKPTKSLPVGPALGQQGVNIMEFCKQPSTLRPRAWRRGCRPDGDHRLQRSQLPLSWKTPAGLGC